MDAVEVGVVGTFKLDVAPRAPDCLSRLENIPASNGMKRVSSKKVAVRMVNERESEK
jgi:hypothetical protein